MIGVSRTGVSRERVSRDEVAAIIVDREHCQDRPAGVWMCLGAVDHPVPCPSLGGWGI